MKILLSTKNAFFASMIGGYLALGAALVRSWQGYPEGTAFWLKVMACWGVVAALWLYRLNREELGAKKKV